MSSTCRKCGENDERKLSLCYTLVLKSTGETRGYYYCRSCNKDRKNKWKRNNQEKYHAGILAHAKRNPEKVRARVLVRKLEKEPCFRCGIEKAQAHHEDYSKPLEVLWLCTGCHADLHREKKLQLV